MEATGSPTVLSSGDGLASISLDDGLGPAAGPDDAAAVQEQPAAAAAAPEPPPEIGVESAHDDAAQLAAAGAAAAAPAATPAATPAAPSAAHGAAVKVWVKEPQTEERRLGISYTSYLVRSEASQPLAATHAAASSSTDSSTAAAGAADSTTSAAQHGQPPYVTEVRRRFSDFEALHKLLRAHWRGLFLPPLPDKALLGGAAAWRGGRDSFLAVRQVDLQAYLRSVLAHPGLQHSEELLLFLMHAGELAGCSRWSAMLARPAPLESLRGLLRPAADGGSSGSGGYGTDSSGGASGAGMMLRMKASLLNVVQPHKPRPELPADEQQLRQAKERLKELQQHLMACVSAVRALVSQLEAAAEGSHELGRALSHLARYEEALAQRHEGLYSPAGQAAAARGADLQVAGYGLLRQHAVEKQFLLRTGASLVMLHDWSVLVPEAIGALQEREDVLATVQLLETELADKRSAAGRAAAAAAAAAGPGGGDRKLAAAQAAVAAVQDKLASARGLYQLMKQRNQGELERLALQRTEQFATALRQFARVQAAVAAAAAQLWAGVVEQFDAGGEAGGHQQQASQQPLQPQHTLEG